MASNRNGSQTRSFVNFRSASGYGSINYAHNKFSDTQYKSDYVGTDNLHYLTPRSPLSARSRNEGDFGLYDYIRLLREPDICFGQPDSTTLSSSNISCVEPALQRTITLVKPEAMPFQDTVLRAIFEAGFQIIDARTLHLTPEQVSEIYVEHYGTPSFPHLVVSISSSPCLAVCIAANNVISKWNEILGADKSLREDWFYPMSMRVRFGLHDAMPQAIHASENLKESNKENRYFYPENILEPLIKEEERVIDYCGLHINPTLLNGLTELVKAKPVDPILFLAEWLLLNNPFQPTYPYKIAVLPT